VCACATQKITPTNSWDVALIDYFHDMSLLKEGNSINFQKASCTLDGCVKIYTTRIDSVASETSKLLSGLAESDTRKKGRGNEEDGEGSDDEDGDEDGEGKRKPKRKVCWDPGLNALMMLSLTLLDPTFVRSHPCEGFQSATNQKARARIFRRPAIPQSFGRF
jgi:hypothetical protein